MKKRRKDERNAHCRQQLKDFLFLAHLYILNIELFTGHEI